MCVKEREREGEGERERETENLFLCMCKCLHFAGLNHLFSSNGFAKGSSRG